MHSLQDPAVCFVVTVSSAQEHLFRLGVVRQGKRVFTCPDYCGRGVCISDPVVFIPHTYVCRCLTAVALNACSRCNSLGFHRKKFCGWAGRPGVLLSFCCCRWGVEGGGPSAGDPRVLHNRRSYSQTAPYGDRSLPCSNPVGLFFFFSGDRPRVVRDEVLLHACCVPSSRYGGGLGCSVSSL